MNSRGDRVRDTRISRRRRPSSQTRKAAAQEPATTRRGAPPPPPHSERPGAAIFPWLLSRELRRKRRGVLASPALASVSGQRPRSPRTEFHAGAGSAVGDPRLGTLTRCSGPLQRRRSTTVTNSSLKAETLFVNLPQSYVGRHPLEFFLLLFCGIV